MNMNEDYKKGVKYLLQYSKKYDINVRKYQWLLPFLKKLSELNACHNFCVNIVRQGNLPRLEKFETTKDIFHSFKPAFQWAETDEGFAYWKNIDRKLFGKYEPISNNKNYKTFNLKELDYPNNCGW